MSNDGVNKAVLSLRSINCFVKNIKIFLHTPRKLTGVGSRASLILNTSARFKRVISRKFRLLEHREKSPQYSEPLRIFGEDKNLCLPGTDPQVIKLIILEITILSLRLLPYVLTKIFEYLLFSYANSATEKYPDIRSITQQARRH